MDQSKTAPEQVDEEQSLNDSWFDRPGRSLTPIRYPSERPSYDYVETRPSDIELDDAWFV